MHFHSKPSLDGAKAPNLRLGHAQVNLGATLAFRLIFDFAQDDTAKSNVTGFFAALPFRMTGWDRRSTFGAIPTDSQCIFTYARRFPLDGGNDSKTRTLSSHFPRIPIRISQSLLKTFYYYYIHDQIASYRASL